MNQLVYRTVGNPPLDTRHQLIVWDRVNVAFQIGIVHGLRTILQPLFHRIERIMRRTAGEGAEGKAKATEEPVSS